MLTLGEDIANKLSGGCVIYLIGQLGAGKTTLTRGILHGLGHPGSVKSPTFTLVEPYEVNGKRVFHFDLYRLVDAEELEYLGIRDYFVSDSISIVEWPEKGAGVLPKADLQITIDYKDAGRHVRIIANTDRGVRILAQLN